jgi:hypothetical protein
MLANHNILNQISHNILTQVFGSTQKSSPESGDLCKKCPEVGTICSRGWKPSYDNSWNCECCGHRSSDHL